MKAKLSFLASILLTTFLSIGANAQVYETLEVQSGFNEDVIANGVGSAISSTTNDVDGVSYNFLSRDFKATAASPDLTYGFPNNGMFYSEVTATSGLYYQLAPYSGSNVLRLANVSDAGTLTFTSPKPAYNLYMISTSGSGTSTVDVLVTFSDATTQLFSGIAISDWYDAANYALRGFGRVNRTNNNLESGSGTNPRIYQANLDIDVSNEAKLIQSVTVTKVSGTGISNIFGFSVNLNSSCLAASGFNSPSANAMDATIAWTPPTTVPAMGYDIYYSTSNTPPTPSTAPNPGYTGLTGGSATISGLMPSTTYYVWIRSVCSPTSNSGWVGPISLTTSCVPVSTLPMIEGFENGNSQDAEVTGCWVQNSITGTQVWSANSTLTSYNRTPRTGSWNAYLRYSNEDWMMKAVELTAGINYEFEVYARQDNSNASHSDITLAYGSTTDPTAFTNITGPTGITNGTYQRISGIFTVPATGVYYVAIKGRMNGTPWYISIDDIKLDVAPTCIPPTILSPVTTPTDATISWTPPTPAPTSYDIYVDTTSTQPATPTYSGVTGTSQVIPGTSGNTYYVWVVSNCGTSTSTAAGPVSYTLPFAPPANDDCTSPIALTPAGDFASGAVAGNNQGGTTTSDASAVHGCQTNSVKEVWYSVVVPASGNITVEVQASSTAPSLTDTVITAYSGSCGGLSSLGCGDDTTGLFSTLVLTGQTPGSTILISVWTYGDAGTTEGNFQIAAYDSSLGTAEIVKDAKDIQVYPNPFTDFINITDIKNIQSISVADMSGRMLRTIENPESRINLSRLQSGVYLLSLRLEDGSIKTIKVIKK